MANVFFKTRSNSLIMIRSSCLCEKRGSDS